MEPKKISEYKYEISKTGKMRVPGIIYANDKILNGIMRDKTIEQIKNVAMLKGIVKASYAMPDAHQGYGFSIGGVAAFDLEKGIVSPGGVGFDINCGVRILATNIKVSEILEKRKQFLNALSREVPSGVGRGHKQKLSRQEIDEILEKGVKWALENNMAVKEDLEKCEENGMMQNANPEDVSEKAKSRGASQLGTLGAGNHFLEIQEIEEIYDEEIAKVFGLEKGQVTIMIHCGSRGLGHQVASDYISEMEKKYGFKNLPDRELINAPINSELGQKYFSAMNCAVNFAFCNRQIIMHNVRQVLKKYFPKNKNHLIYDVAHNIAKIEEHKVGGKMKKLCVHRKGATRSFGPGRKELPKIYQKTGQPVLIPGSMGTASYVLVVTKKAEEISFGSTAHGAGRVMSRHEAYKKINLDKLKKSLSEKNIEIKSGSARALISEAPEVYKNVDEVVKVSHELGIGKLVAKLKPLAVMKG